MSAARLFCGAIAACLLTAAPAQARSVLVLEPHGKVRHRAEGKLAPRDPDARAARAARRFPARAAQAGPTVTDALKAMLAAGAIDQPTYDQRRGEYAGFKDAVKAFSGRRRTDMQGVLDVVDGIAARGQLTPSRLPALWLIMQRNRQWWDSGPLLASGQRVSFDGSELIWQYVPGEGLQIHPLANFGVLNWLAGSSRRNSRTAELLDELLPLAAERAGGLAWEYYFDFDGGRPPWVSGLAQGTGLQAMSKAAVRLGRQADVFPVVQRGLGIFQTPPPEGVRTDIDGGAHYVQYSFAPGLRILNGFIQSLVGLYDYTQVTGDPQGLALFQAGDAAARVEVPTYDTGAWSLYSRGTITRESDLHYHGVLRDFLQSLCDRTQDPVYCTAVDHFDAYLETDPRISLVTRRLRAGRTGTLRFKLDKISTVTLRLVRGGRTVLTRTAVLGRGTQRQTVTPPRSTRRYAVSLTATDLAGNTSSVQGTVKVLKPAKKPKRAARRA